MRRSMTASLVHIPLAAGASLLTLAGRGAGWTYERMARAPMASATLILVSGMTMMAAANALFMQDAPHPAPMFGTAASTPAPVVPAVAPVTVTPPQVVERPAEMAAQTSSQPAATPATATPQPAQQVPSIGNADIAEMQEKLSKLGLFDGTVDGYYGPKTADAIRAFEARYGLPRTGAATPQVIEAVRRATSNTSQAPAPAAQPVPVAEAPAAQPMPDLAALIDETDAPAPAAPAAPEPVVELAAALPVAASTPAPVADDGPAVLNRDLVSDIQTGLTRLGFLQAPVDGVAGETTARAIRQFQIFNNVAPTGEVTPILRDMLVAAGAYM